VHVRNLNAVQNILVRGLLAIEKENSSSLEARAYEADVNKDSGEKLSMAGPGIRYQVSGIRYQVSGIRYQVSGIQQRESPAFRYGRVQKSR
jgi:hypothetical protein